MALDTRLISLNRVVMPIGRLSPTGLQLIGTAFLTNVPGKCVTAAHNVGQDDAQLHLVLPKTQSILDYQDTSDRQVQLAKVRLTQYDPFRDLCVLQTDGETTANVMFGGCDDLGIGSEIVSFGFPHCDHGRMVLTYQHAEVGAKILVESSGVKSKHIVLNTQARPGQSGSPIFRLPDLTLVAVLLGSYAPGGGGGISLGGVDPLTLHQTTHAISAEYIQGMVNA
jgi:hypothetical protein